MIRITVDVHLACRRCQHRFDIVAPIGGPSLEGSGPTELQVKLDLNEAMRSVLAASKVVCPDCGADEVEPSDVE